MDLLRGTMGARLAAWPAELLGQRATPPSAGTWDPGRVRHLLPAVSDSRMLVEASFAEPFSARPTLRIGSLAV